LPLEIFAKCWQLKKKCPHFCHSAYFAFGLGLAFVSARCGLGFQVIMIIFYAHNATQSTTCNPSRQNPSLAHQPTNVKSKGQKQPGHRELKSQTNQNETKS